MSAPRVSIIVTCYRKFEEIFATIDSILMQEYENIEIIIQDDGSCNYYEYADTIREYIEKNKKDNIKSVIFNHLSENVGTSKNCNEGINVSSGQYIKLLPPGDDLYNSKVITESVKYMEEHGARILIGQTFVRRREHPDIIDEVRDTAIYRWKARSGRMCNITPTNRDIKYLQGLCQKECNALLASRCIISTISVFFRRDLLQETKGFLEEYRLIEDMTYWPFIAKRGEKFFFANIIMTIYSLDGISNGGENSNVFNEDYCKIMSEIYIENEYRFGKFCGLLKRIRRRELETLKRNDSFLMKWILYFDVQCIKLYRNIRYLLLGTKL